MTPGDSEGRRPAGGAAFLGEPTTTVLRVPQIDPDASTLDHALAYAADGWYVLPVDQRTKHAGSVVGKDWPSKSSRDPHQLAAWFAGTDHGIALHVGRSGAVVLDVDDPARLHTCGPLLAALTFGHPPHQLTRTDDPIRGHHVYAVPPGRVIGNGVGRLGEGWGDVRGRNGIVVVAPTRHAKADQGGLYRWAITGPVPTLPPELDELLPANTSTPDSAATDTEVARFIAAHDHDVGPRGTALLAAVLDKAVAEVAAGASRHVTCCTHLTWALDDARAGLYSTRLAVDTFESWFAGVKPDATRGEFAGLLAWAVGQVAGKPQTEVDARRARLEGPPRVPARDWSEPAPVDPPAVRDQPAVAVRTLAECESVFRRWLGPEYDLAALHAVLAAAAVEQLDGDPVWLLLVSGSGNAKTETVQALVGAGAQVVSTIASEGALLSATSSKERSKHATGGLLRAIGDRGVLVVKDVTSILSMPRETRGSVLAALREVYDGQWTRTVGTDGGRTLSWSGRLVVIGATTSAYDAAHSVIASMGERFALLRVDSREGRLEAGRQALRNVGSEVAMRAELAEAVGGVLAAVDPAAAVLTEDTMADLLALADVVTLARTAVERDSRGDVLDAHLPEAPTRFAKMLGQLVRGGRAVGMTEVAAHALAARVARDSLPPTRLVVLADVLAHPLARTADVQKRTQKPRTTADRTLQELQLCGLLVVTEVADGLPGWRYSVAPGIDTVALRNLVTGNVSKGAKTGLPGRQQDAAGGSLYPPEPRGTDISGQTPEVES